mgnify:FL=1
MKVSRLLFIFTLLTTVLLAACGSESSGDGEDKTTIKVGTSPGPYSELFIDAIVPILEDEGYTIETTDFTELLQADIALDEGSIDLNVDQHTAYYENFNNEKGANLTSITPIPTVPTGIFPGRKDSLDDIEEGDVIGIPKDPSNAARAYAVLQKAGLITLEEDVELVKVTQNDIVENKLNLDIQEMDSAQIPRALEDLDYGVIPGSIVYASGLDASLSLLHEDILKDLELVAVVDEKNKDTNWAQAVKAAYESDEFKAYMEEHNQEDYWFIPEEIR